MASIKKIVSIIFVASILLMTLVMSFPSPKLFTSAEGEPVIYNLISTTSHYSHSIYGVSDTEKEDYTPFDSEKNTYYGGWSINPVEDTYNQINSTYSVLDIGEVDLTDKSVFVWLYFSSLYLHENYEIILNTTTKNIVLSISSQNLESVLKKTGGSNEEGYSWNLLELPIDEKGVFEVNSITFKTYSSAKIENANIADINIYNVYIQGSEANYINAKVKQLYLDFGVLNPTSEKIESLHLGDTLSFPVNIREALSYAFYGKYNLLDSGEANWKVGVKQGNGNVKYYNLGETVTFDKEGPYIVFYDCYFMGKEVVAKPIGLNIEKFVGAYFESSSYKKLEVGKSYYINYKLNPAFTPTEQIEVVYNSDYVDATLDNGKIKVTVKKKGDTDLKIKIKGTRTGVESVSEYEVTTKLNLINQPKDKYHTFKIFSYVFLGLVVIAIIVFMVKSFVKSRKIIVK